MAFQHDTITPFSKDSGSKTEQVAKMFDQIAFRYDFLNRFLSAGIDVGWRKKAILELKKGKDGNEVHPRVILDVATGTADIALLTCKLLQPGKITGIDISDGMLELGRKKIAAKNLEAIIDLQHGDSEAIHFADKSFDAVTVAFGVRNFANLEKGLGEMLRVLKPGGKLMVLEFSKPRPGIIGSFYQLYTKIIAPQAGRMIAKNKDAYQYLNDSIEAFPEGEAFLGIMKAAGFSDVYRKPLTGGICNIYCGFR